MSLADKLTTVAENMPKVYQAGYDSFWDSYQLKGKRTDYNHGFRGMGWWNSFKPKYDLQPLKTTDMFAGWGYVGNGVTVDLVDLLEEAGITLDFSKATTLSEVFNSSTIITHIGVIDASSATTCGYIFNCASALKTVDKFIVTDKITSFAGAFDYCPALENIVFEGTIAANMNVSACTKLTRESLLSIIAALKKFTSGTHTLTIGDTNKAKLTADEIKVGTDKGWTIA
jgi:hypothetical protein